MKIQFYQPPPITEEHVVGDIYLVASLVVVIPLLNVYSKLAPPLLTTRKSFDLDSKNCVRVKGETEGIEFYTHKGKRPAFDKAGRVDPVFSPWPLSGYALGTNALHADPLLLGRTIIMAICSWAIEPGSDAWKYLTQGSTRLPKYSLQHFKGPLPLPEAEDESWRKTEWHSGTKLKTIRFAGPGDEYAHELAIRNANSGIQSAWPNAVKASR